jgi:hypothetical protein
VQLKSVEAPVFIENQTLISYSFEVSRLHYMLHSIPPVSVIVLYWPGNDTLYYDFAEAIYTRLLEKREGNMTWKSQTHVNIHVPASNIINPNNLARIHQTVLACHQNSKDRSPALYPDLVTKATPLATSISPVPGIDPAAVLREKGMTMLYNNELPTLIGLIDQTPLKVLREDSHLSLLAGLTNFSSGSHVEAYFWLTKALGNPVITDDDHAHVSWTKRFLDMVLGKISLQDYGRQLKEHLQQVSADNEEQRLNCELAITRNEIDLLGPNDLAAIFDVPNRCLNFSYRISTTKLTASAAVALYLQNVTNLGAVLIKFNLFIRQNLVAGKRNGKKIHPELIGEVEFLTAKLKREIEITFMHLKPIARNYVSVIKLALCFETQVSIWLELTMSELINPIKKFDFHSFEYKKQITLYTSFAKEALQTFMDHLHYLDAYNLTLMLLELGELAAHSDVILDIDMQATSHQADWLQKKLEVPSRHLHAKALINAYISNGHSDLEPGTISS